MSSLHYLYGAVAEGHLSQIARERELNDIANRVENKVSAMNGEIAQLREIVRRQQAEIAQRDDLIAERDAFISQAIAQSKEREAIIREMQREVRRFNSVMDRKIHKYISTINPEASPLADALVDMLQRTSGVVMPMSVNRGPRAEFVQLFNDQLRRFADRGIQIGEQDYIEAGNLAYSLLTIRVMRDLVKIDEEQAARNSKEDPAIRRARERAERERLAAIKNDGI